MRQEKLVLVLEQDNLNQFQNKILKHILTKIPDDQIITALENRREKIQFKN